jgi:hypothetical protein
MKVAFITRAFGVSLAALAMYFPAFSQTIVFSGKHFVCRNVRASVVKFQGAEVMKVERDLVALPFDSTRMDATVDEPTFVKLNNHFFENGTIEVKMWSQIQDPSPFRQARGFIGIAFRIADQDSAFESIYLRPQNGRARSQLARNHTVQYFSYPHFKFYKLRRDHPGEYESWAPVGLGEWITMRLEVKGSQVEMFINDDRHADFVVEKLKGVVNRGAIGLWVDIGTIAYFKDLKIVTHD